MVVRDINKRKQAEEALRESERRLSTLMANLPGMAYRCQNRLDWPMEFVSEGCATLTGWPASALLQNRPAYGELIVEADRQPVWDAVQQALAARQPFELTYRIQDAAGRLLWVWERGCGVFAPDGSLLYLEGFITDITKRKETEKKLRQSEETYRNLFQNAQVGLFRTRIEDGQILESNEQLARMFGYDSREEFVGHFVTSQNNVDAGTREKMLEQIRRDGFLRNFEARFYRKDRSIFWARYSARIYPEEGWIEGVCEDITDCKGAEEALRVSRERLMEAQRIAKMGDFTWHISTGAVTWSDSLYDLLGYDRSEKIDYARVNAAIHHSEDLERITEWLEACINSGKTEHGPAEYRLIRKDGQTIHVQVYLRIRHQDGKPVEVFGAAQDITERKRAEEELQRHAEELRIRNDALTRFNAVAVGRELRMIELKREVNELCLKLGEPPRYKIVAVPEASNTSSEEQQ